MKKIISLLALAVLSLAVFSACEFATTQHNHSFNKSWTTTEDEHWRDANCGHELTSSKGAHQWDSGKTTKTPTEQEDGEFTYTCTVCKYTKKTVISRVQHEHTFGGDYLYNSNYHWQKATCEHTVLTSSAEPHRFNGNECFTCRYLTDSEGLTFTQRSDGTYAVSGKGSCRDSKVVIPASYEGAAVTAISRNAFSGVETITKIVIPESVTSIGANAFKGCSYLKEIVWSEGRSNLQTIGSMAFSATPIKEFFIPATVTSIGDGALYYCESLSEIKIEEGNTAYKMENGALYTANGSTLLQYTLSSDATSFTIANTVKTLGYGAFAYSTSLNEITFEEGSSITALPTNAFAFILTLKKINNVPETITSLGDYAFYNCKKLTDLNVPRAITKIGAYAFHGCNLLTPFEIPETVTSIGEYAFAYCNQFTSIAVPGKVTSIGDYAFTGCEVLETISIPASVRTFGKRVFFGCKAITEIVVDKNNPTLSAIDGNLYNKAGTGLVFYCVGKTSEVFNVPNGVTSLYAFSLYEAKNLKKVILPNTLELIREEAFRNCSALEEIVMADSVNTIERAAFMDCKSLTKITIPKSLTTIVTETFRGCHALETLTIPANVTTIEKRAFGTLNSFKRVIFEVTEGWHYLTNIEGAEYAPFDPADIADPEKAAQFLSVTTLDHFNHTWKLNP